MTSFFSNLKEKIPRLFKLAIHHQEKINPTMLRAYTAPFPSPEYCIGGLAFPRDIPIGFSHPSARAMQEVREKLGRLAGKPKILVWGMKDIIFPPAVIKRWTGKLFPGIEVHEIEDASHFLQEDAPGRIIDIITEFMKNT